MAGCAALILRADASDPSDHSLRHAAPHLLASTVPERPYRRDRKIWVRIRRGFRTFVRPRLNRFRRTVPFARAGAASLISLRRGDAGRCREMLAPQAKRGNRPHSVRQFSDNRAKNALHFRPEIAPKTDAIQAKTLYTSGIEYFLHFRKTESVRKTNSATK